MVDRRSGPAWELLHFLRISRCYAALIFFSVLVVGTCLHMLNHLLAAYLLVIFLAWNLWRSLRPKRSKPPRSLLRQYCSMSAHSLALLGVFWAGSSQAGYTLGQLGFDMPLSSAGAWGLACAVLLLCGLWAIGSVIERRKTPQASAEDERKMLESSSMSPSNLEAFAFVVSILVITDGWKVLYCAWSISHKPPVRHFPPVTKPAAARVCSSLHNARHPVVGRASAGYITTGSKALSAGSSRARLSGRCYPRPRRFLESQLPVIPALGL